MKKFNWPQFRHRFLLLWQKKEVKQIRIYVTIIWKLYIVKTLKFILTFCKKIFNTIKTFLGPTIILWIKLTIFTIIYWLLAYIFFQVFCDLASDYANHFGYSTSQRVLNNNVRLILGLSWVLIFGFMSSEK